MRTPRPRRIVPASGSTRPHSTLSSVDLPVPFSPTSPNRSPVDTVTERSVKSGRPGRLMATPAASTRITAPVLPSAANWRTPRARNRALLRGVRASHCPEEGRPLDATGIGDDELVERARNGDTDAFGGLVTRHQPLAIRVAYALVGDDAPDVVQDAMVKAYRNLHRFRPGGPFRAWLLRIVTNEASNRRRSAGRRAQLALRVRDENSSGGTALSPEDVAVANERRHMLAAAVSRLSAMDRRVIALRWFAELSEAEMATALDCAPGTVKSRVSRALDRLRQEIGEERDD